MLPHEFRLHQVLVHKSMSHLLETDDLSIGIFKHLHDRHVSLLLVEIIEPHVVGKTPQHFSWISGAVS